MSSETDFTPEIYKKLKTDYNQVIEDLHHKQSELDENHKQFKTLMDNLSEEFDSYFLLNGIEETSFSSKFDELKMTRQRLLTEKKQIIYREIYITNELNKYYDDFTQVKEEAINNIFAKIDSIVPHSICVTCNQIGIPIQIGHILPCQEDKYNACPSIMCLHCTRTWFQLNIQDNDRRIIKCPVCRADASFRGQTTKSVYSIDFNIMRILNGIIQKQSAKFYELWGHKLDDVITCIRCNDKFADLQCLYNHIFNDDKRKKCKKGIVQCFTCHNYTTRDQMISQGVCNHCNSD